MLMSKVIWLTQGQFALVDDVDYESLRGYNWHAERRKNKFYARGRKAVNGNKIMVYMHSVILNSQTGMVVDHKDGNGLNNQRDNLRSCTQQENIRNQKPRDGYTSAFKGVFFHKVAKKWTAQIRDDYKRIHLGLFVTEIEAARAYDEAAKRLHKQYANLNFK